MPAPSMTKDEVLAILLETFRRDGYDGASLATLSAATGLGKSSLYHHFPGGKEEMVHQVLDGVDAWMRDQVVEPLRGPGAPAAKLERMLRALSGFYANGAKACILGRLCASVDRDRFGARLRQLFAAWIGALAELLVEAGLPRSIATRRAEDAVLRIQGALVLGEGLGSPAPFRRVVRELRSELLAEPPR
jgi:AcrR family transcriptional regulator